MFYSNENQTLFVELVTVEEGLEVQFVGRRRGLEFTILSNEEFSYFEMALLIQITEDPTAINVERTYRRPEPEFAPNDDYPLAKNYKFLIGKNGILSITRDETVNFIIDGSYRFLELKDSKEGTRIVLQAIKTWKEFIQNHPEITFKCVPFDGDGGGKDRASLYKRLGFKESGTCLVFNN